MTRPLRLHAPGVLYHVMSRGNGKQEIFLGTSDYQRFLDLLARTTERFHIECCAYCLMPTHYHALLRPRDEPLSRMMQQLNSVYSQSFNRAHQRVGHVFQGRFKALLVDADEYFLTLLRYTMQNPVVGRLTDLPSAWPWSSYRATAGLCPVPPFLTLDSIWATFDSSDVTRAQRRFVEYVALPEGSVLDLERLLFGSEPFVRAMAPRLEPARNDRELRYAHRCAARPSLATLLGDVSDEHGRRAAIREAFLRHAYTLREIAQEVGCHPSTVWRWVSETDRPRRRLLKMLQQPAV